MVKEWFAGLSWKKKLALGLGAWILLIAIGNANRRPVADEQIAIRAAAVEREATKKADADKKAAVKAERDAKLAAERREREAARALEAEKKASEAEARKIEQERFGTDSGARAAAREAVLKSLKAPSTAKFPWLSTQETHLGNGVWIVKGEVDAENSFGAKLRHQWAVRLKWAGNQTWEVENIQVVPR